MPFVIKICPKKYAKRAWSTPYIAQHVHVCTFVLHVLKISLLHILKFLFFIYIYIYIYIFEITSFRPACCTTQFVSDCGRNPKDSFLMAHMSRVKRKPFILHTRNQRCRSALRYPLTQIVQSFFFINPKLQASRHILQLYSPVCVRPGQKPRRPVFSQQGLYFRGHFLQHVASLFHFALVPKIMKK